jgi:hypothetical protein
MAATDTLEPTNDAPAPRRRFPIARVAAIAVCVAMAGFWVWGFSPLAPDRKVDALSDKTYVTRANDVCRASNAELNALPRAMAAKTAAERADGLDKANAVVAGMVGRLRAEAAGAHGRDTKLLGDWLSDWDAYVQSRQDFASALRTDPNAEFFVPGRPGGQITETMDGFSRTNRIMDCLVPLDV